MSNQNVLRYVNKALKMVEVTDKKVSWKIKPEQSYINDIEVLLEIISLKTKQRLIKKPIDTAQKKELIKKVIIQLKRDGKNEIQEESVFKQALKRAIRNQSLRKAECQYQVVSLLNINTRSLQTRSTIDLFNTKFDLSPSPPSFISPENKRDIVSHISAYHKNVNLNLNRFFWVTTKVNAGNPSEALKKGWDIAEQLRNHINAHFQLNTLWQVHFGRREPLNKIIASPGIAVFDDKGMLSNLAFSEIPYVYKIYSDPKIEKIIQIMEGFNKDFELEEFEIDKLILQSLENFGASFDNIYYNNIFLAHWQILENIALPLELSTKERRPLSHVIKRINLIFGQIEHTEEILNVLYDARNNLVHQGLFNEDGFMVKVNMIRQILRSVIVWMLNNRKKLQNRTSLDLYFAHGNASVANLKRKKQIIQKICDDDIKPIKVPSDILP